MERPTEEEVMFSESVIRFAKSELDDDVLDRDARSEFSWTAWKKCAEFGLLGLPFPSEYGGSDASRLMTVVAMEALGYACKDNGLIFSMNAHMWACQLPIWRFGTEEQKERFLPAMIRGEHVGAHAASEPNAGSDIHNLKTRAERRSTGYVLNGAKTWVTNAPIADIAIVFATVDSAKGLGGITAFIVEKDRSGLSFGQKMEKMGLRTSPMGEVVLTDCEVPEENRIGPEGAGGAIFTSVMEWERSSILAAQVGAMARQLETTVEYAKARSQFGQPIGKFQHVSGKIADMKIRLEACRALLRRVAASEARGPERLIDAAVAKAYISESAVQSSLDAIQVHGAQGYATEIEVERELRDAVGGRIYSGTTEIQKNIIAKCLGL